MKILGISGGLRMGFQDCAAAIVVDGEIVSAIECERLSRVKHAPGKWPLNAIYRMAWKNTPWPI